MLVLDTHAWIWWTQDEARLSAAQREAIARAEASGLGVSAISCWEVAKLVERGRLGLPLPLADWLDRALAYPGVQLIELSPAIIAGSVALPGTFHKDPADQLIVATARHLGVPLVTRDEKILAYPHVETVG